VIAGADENLGKILDTLDELHLAEDTVVVFASDNGYMLGDHSRDDKRVAYEESIRIPLVIRYPRLAGAGTHIDSIVLNTDFAPTLLALAGVPVPDSMQGGDWRGLLAGTTTSLRSQFLYEYFYEDGFDIPTIVGLRTESHKLVTYPGHVAWVELFDDLADRHEITNLAPLAADAALLQTMRDQLAAEKTGVDYQVPPGADTP
jgi:arylsulfatase A-like enzyme